MLHLYTDHESPNGYKILIALEEAVTDYQIHPINLSKGEQCTPQFLAMNPHGRVPMLRDDANGVVVFESAAILLYLAQTFPALMPSEVVQNAPVPCNG